MKKKISILILLVLILSCGIYLHSITSTNDDIMSTIASIENEDSKAKILDLLCTVAYSNASSSDSEEPVKPVNDSYYKKSIEKMSKLTGDDLDKEIAKITKKTVSENIDNSNIQWNRDFVDKYVKKYCPEYYDQLIEKIEKDETVN
ncbi:MAG: hypothetical protein AB9836_09505 [Aminipila sp.]